MIEAIVSALAKSEAAVALKELGEVAIKEIGKNPIMNVINEIRDYSLEGLELMNEGEILDDIKDVFKSMNENISPDFSDGIRVEASKEGGLIYKHLIYPATEIRVSDNVIHANAGSTKLRGQMNQFLNNLSPNKTYVVDGHTSYNTDNLARVMKVTSNRNMAFNDTLSEVTKRSERDSITQKRVVQELGGPERVGIDDSAHLISNSSNGANELINQIPLKAELNRGGELRGFEIMEENALKEGKTVFSERELFYEGDSNRPSEIKYSATIDGEYHEVKAQNHL